MHYWLPDNRIQKLGFGNYKHVTGTGLCWWLCTSSQLSKSCSSLLVVGKPHCTNVFCRECGNCTTTVNIDKKPRLMIHVTCQHSTFILFISIHCVLTALGMGALSDSFEFPLCCVHYLISCSAALHFLSTKGHCQSSRLDRAGCCVGQVLPPAVGQGTFLTKLLCPWSRTWVEVLFPLVVTLKVKWSIKDSF